MAIEVLLLTDDSLPSRSLLRLVTARHRDSPLPVRQTGGTGHPLGDSVYVAGGRCPVPDSAVVSGWTAAAVVWLVGSQDSWLLLTHLPTPLQHSRPDRQLIWEDPSSHDVRGWGCSTAARRGRQARPIDQLLVAGALVTHWMSTLARRGPIGGR
jgi:hypothetical protein